jgi:hypothetical protein
MSSVDPNLSIDARRHFLQALRRVLRPIIRLMLRYGVRYDEFAEVARTAYVESAVNFSPYEVGKQTSEGLAWATGVSQTQIEHYINVASEPLEAASLATSTRTLTEVLHKWHTVPKYLNSDGVPLELEFDSATNKPTFATLVGEINVDVNPNAILDELLDTKCVTRSDGNQIRVLTRTLIFPQGGILSIDYFGLNLSRMIETLEHNLSSSGIDEKRLERSVFADRGIPIDLIPEFHAFATERATKFLYDLDDWLAQYEAQHEASGEARNEVGVNLFFYIETPADARPLSAMVQPIRQSAPERNESSK